MSVDTTARHRKFDDTDEEVGVPQITPAENNKNKNNKIQDSDSDSDSDDDAPEEANVQQDKEEITKQEQLQKQVHEEQMRLEKEKRRERNKFFMEQKKSVLQETQLDQIDELPMELLQEVDQVEIPQALPKRINFNELDTQDLNNELKVELKQRKKSTLKQLRRLQQNKGPVTVRVLSSADKRKPPKRESQIMATRDRWLKRKALNKK